MKPMLAPLVGDAKTVSVIGLCKNAGKTTAMCRLLAEWDGETVAVTSVGRDGERTDLVTKTAKPEIRVRKGTLFATAKQLLPLCDVTMEVLDVTGVHTPLGQVAVLRALSDGCVQLAGPSAVGQLAALEARFRAFGAQRVVIDGAAGRKSLAAAGEDGCALVCVGASMEGGISAMADETAHVCALFESERVLLEHEGADFALFDETLAPLHMEYDGEGQPLLGSLPKAPCVLWVKGGVTTPMLRALARRGAPTAVAAPDATHFLFDRGAAQEFGRWGGKLLVEKKLTVAAVCANPWSAYGNHVNRDSLLAALRRAVCIPVVDVKEEWT